MATNQPIQQLSPATAPPHGHETASSPIMSQTGIAPAGREIKKKLFQGASINEFEMDYGLLLSRCCLGLAEIKVLVRQHNPFLRWVQIRFRGGKGKCGAWLGVLAQRHRTA